MIDASAVADAFDLGAHPVLADTPDRGELGEVWRLHTDSGTWAVKRAFDRVDESQIELAADLQAAARDNGVFAPAVIRSRDGGLAAEIGSAQIRVYDWVDVAALDRFLDPAAVGAAVARIHSAVTPTSTGEVDAWFTQPVPTAVLDETIEALTTARAPFAEALARHRVELLDAATLVRPPGQTQPCHRDLFADNVRASADGRVCVLDWDNAGSADPDYELAFVLWEFARDDPDRAAALYDAYQRAGGPGRVDGPEAFSMIISVASRLLHRVCRLWLDPATSESERERRARDAEEWITDPCSPAVIEELLAAL